MQVEIKTLGPGEAWEIAPLQAVHSLTALAQGDQVAQYWGGSGSAGQQPGLRTGTPWWLALEEAVSEVRDGKKGGPYSGTGSLPPLQLLPLHIRGSHWQDSSPSVIREL